MNCTILTSSQLCQDGKLEIVSGNAQLIVTNIRYYYRQQAEAEKKFHAKSDILRNAPYTIDAWIHSIV